MSDVQLRLCGDVFRSLMAEIQRGAKREAVAFGLVSHGTILGSHVLPVQRLIIPPERAFLPSAGHGAKWSGAYTIELLNEAASKQLGICIFHYHGGTRVGLSLDDKGSALELLPKFQLIIPNRPHGSVVLGTDSVAGLVLLPGETDATDRVSLRYFSHKIETYPPPEAPPRSWIKFGIQPLARGTCVSRITGRSRIVVAGQSGGGAHVTQQSVQLGIGEVVGIDDDCADEGTRFSAVGIGEQDISKRTLKIDAIARNIAAIVPSVKYVGIPTRIPEPEALEQLKRADIIVGCVNNLHARADIQEIALRYLIPYIDIGLVLATEDNSIEEYPRVTAISGNVFTFVPGGPCLWCTEFLTQDKLDRETELRGRPYLKNADKADALVVSFNGVLASQAVSETLQLLIGFAPGDLQYTYKKFDGFSGTLVGIKVKRNPACPKCGSLLAAGQPLWRQIHAPTI